MDFMKLICFFIVKYIIFEWRGSKLRGIIFVLVICLIDSILNIKKKNLIILNIKKLNDLI